MAPKGKAKEEVTVVAELLVTSGGETQAIRTHGAAWHAALALPRPVNVVFNRWVRKDKKDG